MIPTSLKLNNKISLIDATNKVYVNFSLFSGALLPPSARLDLLLLTNDDGEASSETLESHWWHTLVC